MFILLQTLLMDAGRLQQIAGQFEVLVNTVSTLTFCLHFFSPHLATDEEFIQRLKQNIFVLIDNSKWYLF